LTRLAEALRLSDNHGMNAPLQLHMDKAEFLRWVEGREGHFELKDSHVIMMTGGTIEHALVTAGLERSIAARVDIAKLWVTSADLAVEIDDDIRYPDVVVQPAGLLRGALSTKAPLLVAEILSKSSLALDFNIKAAEYMSLPSLECYIVAAQEEPRLWIWNRKHSDESRIWPRQPDEIIGRDAQVPLPFLGLELPMAEIYAAIQA
jgi:Uma2 family endonuclease